MNGVPITRGDALQMLRRRLHWLERRIADPRHRPDSPGGIMVEKEAASIRWALEELAGKQERRA